MKYKTILKIALVSLFSIYVLEFARGVITLMLGFIIGYATPEILVSKKRITWHDIYKKQRRRHER
uniref:Uncharacterized protein n=1 Tax=viral metagenome TaxID=1070528 RepID=A0A6M3XY13_9ZZZZ